MAALTKEMTQWLSDNRDTYEFYLLHSMFHDPLMRASMLGVPVTTDDFGLEEHSLAMGALVNATKISNHLGKQVPCPPTYEFLRTYLEVAARTESSDDEIVGRAVKIIRELQDPAFTEQHYCVKPYFEAWYSGNRAKKAAKMIMRYPVPDVQGQIGEMQRALNSASMAVSDGEDDPMDSFLTGQELVRVLRRPSGIGEFDTCLNGGWGRGECYLLFGGTGSGKSIAAGQFAWWEAFANDGWPLIVTTELMPREYAARTVSNAAGIPINIIQDCENIEQVRQDVMNNPASMYRIKKVDEVLAKFSERIRIHKVSPEDGMNLKDLLERECMRYEAKMGRRPTWICLDWLGSVADVNGAGGKGGTSERALAWEMSANSGVRFADESGIPTLILAQAVNDAQLKRILTIGDIGISKGIGKNMVLAVGVTNSIDKAGILAAERGKADMPRSMILENQFFCVCKARKGEGLNIPVRREFRFQRFTSAQRD
jgi:hypothetical protein